MSGWVPGFDVVDAVVSPERFVRTRRVRRPTGLLDGARSLAGLAVFYLLNLLLYVVPITLAWSSAVDSIQPDDGIIIAGGAFLLLTLTTLTTFHVALVLTGNSHGLLASTTTVGTTMGVYLAGALGFAFPLVVSDGPVGELLRYVTFYELLASADATQFTADPGPVTAALGTIGVAYFLYSLYLAARVHHGASRFSGLVATAVVLTVPAAFAAINVATTGATLDLGYVGTRPLQALLWVVASVVALDVLTPTDG